VSAGTGRARLDVRGRLVAALDADAAYDRNPVGAAPVRTADYRAAVRAVTVPVVGMLVVPSGMTSGERAAFAVGARAAQAELVRAMSVAIAPADRF